MSGAADAGRGLPNDRAGSQFLRQGIQQMRGGSAGFLQFDVQIFRG